MLAGLNINNDNFCKIDKKIVHQIVGKLKNELSFTIDDLKINFVNSQFIHEVNVEYLKHDFSTDIITFNYSGSNDNLEGEIFISYEDAQRNAEIFNCTLQEEILRLIIHGILHLTGQDDISAKDKKEMKAKEDKYIELCKNFLIKDIVTL